MKILIISQYFYPEHFLINDIAFSLKAIGHDVVVLTGLPNYPKGVIFDEYKGFKKEFEIINDVKVYRCKIVPRGHSKIKRIINYLSYSSKAKSKIKSLMKEYNFDISFVYGVTPITQLIPAIYLKRKFNVKIFFYNLDLAPMSGERFLKLSILKSIYKKKSASLLNNCDLIGVSSLSFVDYNHCINNISKEKMFYLPQYCDERYLSFDYKFKKANKCNFLFAGNIGSGLNFDTLILSAQELLKDNMRFHFHVVGDGSDLKRIKANIHKLQLLDYFTFYGHINYENMGGFFELADALIILLRKGQITIPAKLQSYMTVGKPIIGSMDGSGMDIIKESRCGICVDAENIKELSAALKEFILNKNGFSECGKNARNYYISNFKKELFYKRLEEGFRKI